VGYANVLKSLYPNSHSVNAQVYSAILGAIGASIDQYDPVQIGLAQQFSITTATNSSLDSGGKDWGLTRRLGESDNTFRQRILSLLPLYSNGPTVPGITAAVATFTGANPTIFEYGPGAFRWADSAWSEAGFSNTAGLFTYEIHVANPNNVTYNHSDMETIIQICQMARSTAILYHNGTDTSPLGEASNAVVNIVSTEGVLG
jgi:hypothetical protein